MDETLTSLTQIETSLDEIRDTDTAVLREEEDAVTEIPSIVKLLTEKLEFSETTLISGSGGME